MHISGWPLTWHVNYGQTKLRPAHSIDVAHALEVMLDAELTSIGQTFSLAGPRTYTINQLLNLVQSLTFEKIRREGLNVPKFMLKAATKIADKAWWPMLSPDEVDRRYIDDLADEPGTKSWADLGIEPDTIEEVAIVYLRRYRSNLRFEQPVETGGSRLKKGKYHVVD
jgi:NADH dehydrogenase (ubiquinone) 1 alpha subcomplex subunit 9